jgi:hypothetical protein
MAPYGGRAIAGIADHASTRVVSCATALAEVSLQTAKLPSRVGSPRG